MKKSVSLFLVFTLLLVSGNLFAKDESLFRENFSLSTQSKTYPTLNLTYHILGYPTSNNTDNCKFGFPKEQGLEVSSSSLAELYLRRLAEKRRENRRFRGAAGIIGGGICLSLGVAAWSSMNGSGEWEGFWEDLWKSMTGSFLVIVGGTSIAVGSLILAIPSGAERELKNVLRISNPAKREVASREALSCLAARGKRSRIISSIILTGYSAYFLFSKNRDYYSAGTFGAFAVYSLIRKTPGERAFRNYQKVEEEQKKLGFHVGIEPRGGVMVCLSLSY